MDQRAKGGRACQTTFNRRMGGRGGVAKMLLPNKTFDENVRENMWATLRRCFLFHVFRIYAFYLSSEQIGSKVAPPLLQI